jgi:PAS domain S-box-containing protein
MPAAPPGVVETGAPSFVVLGPEALGLSSSANDLHLLSDGRVLVVSTRELAFGDGVRWQTFRGADDSEPIYAQVAVDASDRIYSGVNGGIARVVIGEDARWRFERVADSPGGAEGRGATMVSVNMLDNAWYWHAGSGSIVAWRPGETARVVGNLPTIHQVFELNSQVFVSEQASGGLFRLRPDGSAELVTGTPRLASETVRCAAPYRTGELLVGTNLAGLKIFDGTQTKPFAATGLLHDVARISDLCAIRDGLYAAAVDTFGIIFFNRDGQVVQVLERSLDHRLARVQRLRYSPNGVLWALLNDGVARIEFPSPVSHFEPLLASGLSYAQPLRHAGRLWIMADGRAMRGVYDSADRLERFEDDTPPGRYLFTLADVAGHLLASNEIGVSVRDAAGWRVVLPGLVNIRICSTRTPARGWLYAAQGEIGFLRPAGDGFTTERFPAPELGDNYNAIEDAAGVVWLELGTSRIGRLDPRGEKPTLRIFGPGDGLPDGWAEAFLFEGVARFHLIDRLFRFDDAQQRFVEDIELLNRLPLFRTAGGRPVQDRSGQLWYTARGAARVVKLNAAGEASPEITPVPAGPAPIEYTVEAETGVVWMFVSPRLVRYDPRVSPPPATTVHAEITGVQLPASNRHLLSPGQSLAPLDYADNSVVIHFAAPENPFGPAVAFEVLLEGADGQWVPTGTVGSAAFNRLKEGRYVFHVRPVIGGTVRGGEAHLAFTVRPPWFRTRLAWSLYIAAAIGVLAFAAWFSAFLQRRENQRLERLVAARTGELNATNTTLARQIEETTEKSAALAASEERFRSLNAALEERVRQRTAELSLSNAELQQRETLFRLIFEHAPVGISWKRADLGDAHHFNSTFRRILELPASSLADYAVLSSLMHPEDGPLHREMRGLIASGARDNFEMETRFVLPTGRIVWSSLSVAVVRDATGRIVQDIGILEDITARKRAEHELAQTYKNLIETSRMAGMAEVATGVLHNVGNVLNSLNVSSGVIAAAVRESAADGLLKLSTLLADHAGDLGAFFTHDRRAKLVPEYLDGLARRSQREREWLLKEIASMQQNIDHIKEIVAMQQNHATVVAVVETLDAATLFEDALRINAGADRRHTATVVREFQPVPAVTVEKGKVVQILTNLLRNAHHACAAAREQDGRPRQITLRIEPGAADTVRFVVADDGIGISAENLTRIFSLGFTTRRDGHGFGLHYSALAAREMKGALTVHSAGPGHGATFTLEIPVVGHDLPADGANPSLRSNPPMAVRRP